MENNIVTYYNALIERLQAGELLSTDARIWLSEHPIENKRYGSGHIISDIIFLEPGRKYMLVVQCQRTSDQHPIVPTFTIPFQKGGHIQMKGVVGQNIEAKNMKKSTKLSFRMLSGLTVIAECVSDSGLLMISYQGWVPDLKPFPLWYETISCDRFAMKKTVLSDNMIQYSCCGADGTEDAFIFVINWHPI